MPQANECMLIIQEFFNFDFADDIYEHLAVESQFGQDFGIAGAGAKTKPDFSSHQATTGWTVDDPDIASVARYL